MKHQLIRRTAGAAAAVAILITGTSAGHAQTAGSARLNVTLRDYNGNGTRHWTVAWVTTESGTFIKSLWKQGPSISASHWNQHCSTWYSAKSGSTALDGYSSATAANYSGTNSPVILTWNGRDAANALMPDGNYKFWVQYAEDSGQGPVTTGGLLWTKRSTSATSTYPDQGSNFANMSVAWTPDAPATVAPTITSAAPPATGTVGTPYNHTVTAAGTAPITFTATGLPDGLTLTTAGVLSGTPTAAGTFAGTITAANGTLPNATQAFSIVISTSTVTVTGVTVSGSNLVLNGTGPANGSCVVLGSTDLGQPVAQWTTVTTITIGADGTFQFTGGVEAGVPQRFYLLRLE